MLIAIIASGPDKGQVYEFSDRETVTLGRTTGPIKFSDSKISRQHVKLWCEGGQWFARDLDSRHGTFRNNKPIADSPRVHLQDGDRLQIGRTVLVFSRVPVEHARQLEVLHDPANEPIPLEEDHAPSRSISARHAAPRIGRRSMLWPLAAAAAIAMIGLNVFMLVDARRQNAQLRAALEQPREQRLALETEHLVDALRTALAEQPDETADMLRQVLARLESGPSPEQFAAAEARHQKLLETILAEVKLRQEPGDVAVTLDDVLAAVKQQPELTEALVQEHLATIDAARHEQQKMLKELFAAVQAQPAQLHAIRSEIVEAIKAQPQPTDPEPLLREVLARLDERGKADDAAVKQVLDALAAQPDATRALFTDVLGRLDALAAAEGKAQPDPRIDELLEAVKAQPQQIEPALQKLAAKLDKAVEALPATRQEIVAAIEASLADLPDKQATVLKGVLAEVADQADPADEAVLKEILAAVRQQPTREQIAAAMQDVLARQPRDGEEALREVLAAVRAQPTTEQIAAAVAARLPEIGLTKEQLAAAVDQSMSARLSQRDQFLADILAEVRKRPDAAHFDLLKDVLAAVQAQPAEAQQMLGQVLARLDEPIKAQRDPLLLDLLAAIKALPEQDRTGAQLEEALARLSAADAEQARTLRQIADAVAAQPESTRTLVNEVLAKLDATRTDPTTEAMLKEVLASLKEREALVAGQAADAVALGGDRHEALLRQVLAELRSRNEPIAQAVLEGLRHELRQTQLAVAAPASGSSRGSAPPPSPVAVSRSGEPIVSVFPNIDPMDRLATASRPSTVTRPASPEAQLTETQLAYKRAWETGEPIILGARTDAATGVGLEGRVLDPARARANGITRWQDWYMIDDLAEQERLRLAATQFNTSRPSPLTTPLYQVASGAGGGQPAIAQPRRVVFILDASESLRPALPIAIERLREAVDALNDTDTFTVLVYREREVIEVPPRGLKPATVGAIEQLVKWLDPIGGQLAPRGFASPLPALQQALALRPDDIHLISAQLAGDRGGQLSPAMLLAGVRNLRQDHPCRIHALELFNPDASATMRRLAEQHGGTYRFVADPSQSTAIPGGGERHAR